jgi:biotin operon repressor
MSTTLNKSLFAQVKGELIFDTTLSDGAYRFFTRILYLCGKNDHCWHSQEALAAIMGCSTRSIRKWKKECEDAGILLVKHRFHDTNQYYPLVKVIPQNREVIHDELPPTEGRSNDSGLGRNQSANKSHAPNNNQYKRAYSPEIKIPEQRGENYFAKTAAFLRGERVQWSN